MPYEVSMLAKYNDVSKPFITRLFGGFKPLVYCCKIKSLSNVCLKEEGVITIPGPLEGVRKCILTKRDQAQPDSGPEFTGSGESPSIGLKIVHPTNRKPFIITAMIRGIENCAPTSTPSNTLWDQRTGVGATDAIASKMRLSMCVFQSIVSRNSRV